MILPQVRRARYPASPRQGKGMTGRTYPAQAPLKEVKALVFRADIRLGGSTGARVMGASDGNFYICKAPRFSPEPHPYLLANEQVCKNLADLLNLPTVPSTVVNLRGEKLFGSLLNRQMMDLKAVEVTRENLKNWEDVPAILVFDIFICNVDRHTGNSLALLSPGEESFQLFIVDHSHALMGAATGKRARLQENHPLERYLTYYDLNSMIESRSDFDRPLSHLERLGKKEIAGAVECLPREWLPNYQENVVTITKALVIRRDNLRRLLERQLEREGSLPPIKRVFPNLRSG